MNYKCLKYNSYTSGEYSLIPLRYEDIFLIKRWRNDQMDVLRQKRPLTDEDQEAYFRNIITPAFGEDCPSHVLFSFLKDVSCIGYGGLTNIHWESKRFELSFLADTNRAGNEEMYSEDFSAYLKLITEVVFEDLGFNRIFTETFDIRPLHISLLEKNGFVYEGRMREHICISGVYYDSLIHGFIKRDYESER